MDHCYPTDMVKIASEPYDGKPPAKACVSMKRNKVARYDDTSGNSYLTDWVEELLTSQFDQMERCKTSAVKDPTAVDSPSEDHKKMQTECAACARIKGRIKTDGMDVFIPIACLKDHEPHFTYKHEEGTFDPLDLWTDTTDESRPLCFYHENGIQYKIFLYRADTTVTVTDTGRDDTSTVLPL